MGALLDTKELARRKFYRSGGVGFLSDGFVVFLMEPMIIKLK
jgi:hypothetical protein